MNEIASTKSWAFCWTSLLQCVVNCAEPLGCLSGVEAPHIKTAQHSDIPWFRFGLRHLTSIPSPKHSCCVLRIGQNDGGMSRISVRAVKCKAAQTGQTYSCEFSRYRTRLSRKFIPHHTAPAQRGPIPFSHCGPHMRAQNAAYARLNSVPWGEVGKTSDHKEMAGFSTIGIY